MIFIFEHMNVGQFGVLLHDWWIYVINLKRKMLEDLLKSSQKQRVKWSSNNRMRKLSNQYGLHFKITLF